MKAMADTFQKLLNKFKFEKPVSADVRKYIRKTQSGSLKSALKSLGQYNTSYGMVISTNVTARRIGLRTSIAQSRIILAGVTAALAGIAIASIHLSLKTVNMETAPVPAQEKNINMNDGINKPEIKTELPQDKQSAVQTAYRVGIERFGGSEAICDSITDSIIKELCRLKGKDFAVDMRGNKNKNVNLMVMGTSREFGGNILITAKLVNVQTGKILVVESATISGMDKSAAACEKISEVIVKHME